MGQILRDKSHNRDRDVRLMIPSGIRVRFLRGQEYDSFMNKSKVTIGIRA